jgi:hypothetical protein
MSTSKDMSVKCAEHGKEPGYVICTHILSGAAIGHTDHPNKEMTELGSIVCARIPANFHTEEELTLICHCCAAARGYVIKETIH